MIRLLTIVLLCGLLMAQQSSQTPQNPPPSAPAEKGPPPSKGGVMLVTPMNTAPAKGTPRVPAPQAPPPAVQIKEVPAPDAELTEQAAEAGDRIVVTTTYVTAPVLALDRDGKYVSGIRPDQFHLFDNGKEQNIQVDVAYTPISLVICVQANSGVQALLPQVRKIGGLISPLVVGEQGEVALIAYDARVRVLQDFTSDPNLISDAVAKITPGSTSSRMVDAVAEGTRMLRKRPKGRRRIMLVIGETRDIASDYRPREAAINLELANIAFYSVDMSRFITTLTAPMPTPRPETLPPAMRPMPAGVAATPTTVAQTYGLNGARAEFVPALVEVFRDIKAIFKSNPVELFTKATGGREFSFISQRGLEDAIQKIGEELHSEYTIGYSPNNRDENGFHEIVVTVSGRPDVDKIRVKPGYWIAPKPK
jgi:VWFA-related protein